MALITSVLSMRNLFVLSLALNVSLILRTMYEREQSHHWLSLETQKGQAVQETRLALSPTSSSSAATTQVNTQDGGEKILNLARGDPTMFEKYWRQMGDKATVVIPGWQHISYFSDVTNICWFLEPKFAKEVERVHKAVGNAVTEGRHIVVGTGSSQLYLAALYALSAHDLTEPVSVVSEAPYYSVSSILLI
ncbi:hypothetical protein F2P56_019843 [Juglans regia]|uniref:Alliinase C-terminal domain-containing protein n=1 Tax=Juglans regia TaxID=51240 RepID=A0A833X513_JUGRE|nr:hypothetical protein F2P56_019843 [Juglans regia]